MANKTQKFRHHEVVRALRAGMAAGVPNPTVEFHKPDGSKVVIGAAHPAAAAKAAAAARPPAVAAVVKPVAKPVRPSPPAVPARGPRRP